MSNDETPMTAERLAYIEDHATEPHFVTSTAYAMARQDVIVDLLAEVRRLRAPDRRPLSEWISEVAGETCETCGEALTPGQVLDGWTAHPDCIASKAPTPQDVADALRANFASARFDIYTIDLVHRTTNPECIARAMVGNVHDQRELSGTGEDMAAAIVDLHNAVRRWLS